MPAIVSRSAAARNHPPRTFIEFLVDQTSRIRRHGLVARTWHGYCTEAADPAISHMDWSQFDGDGPLGRHPRRGKHRRQPPLHRPPMARTQQGQIHLLACTSVRETKYRYGSARLKRPTHCCHRGRIVTVTMREVSGRHSRPW